jgi:Family of unknown function (DUF6455)
MAIRKRQSTYMREMMEHLGIEPGGVVPRLALSYATALRRCEVCTSRRACRKWLDCRPASGGIAPSFCPNADIFFELQLYWPSSKGTVEYGFCDYIVEENPRKTSAQ